ncbi:MAG TPA: RNA 2',3'-cyclic phosphodiesterase [Dehalococcoidia bacterium]|nr:RNA 2',3'-cyclic phosphodiesterase [Dehalococcoidia bacterium]
MALIRSFVAVGLPEAVKAALTRLQEEVKTGGGRVKWVQPRGVHLTLKFLGYVDEVKVPALVQALTRACEGFGPLEVALSGLGVFPSPSRPRVAWVGLSWGVEKLLRLQEGVEKVLSPFGFPREDRAFTPHLTIARLREGVAPQEARAFGQAFLRASPESVSFKVEGISLMKSQLTPSGAIYTRLAFIPFRGPL